MTAIEKSPLTTAVAERGDRSPAVNMSCVAQLVEDGKCNTRVVGSIPVGNQYKQI